MALNHGTYCSARCLDVLRRYDSTQSLRLYPASDNGDLRRALAQDANVEPENVLVANGSGPLLKTCIPHPIETKIRRSPRRVMHYLLKRVAYPIITTRLTYSKVPASGVRQGLRCVLLPIGPEHGFSLDIGLPFRYPAWEFVRAETAKERERLLNGLRTHDAIEAFPSEANFILCRVKQPWTGQTIHDRLLARGIKVKHFEPFGEERYDEYFRITIGLPEENTQFLARFDDVMGGRDQVREGFYEDKQNHAASQMD